jgi:uncharacterized protein YmfQ (DUF2313 family)
MAAPIWSDADITSALAQHFPVGRAWPRDPSTVFMQTLAALAPTFQRLTARGSNLLVDGFPSTTDELLPEWEASLGLPDPCAGEAPTVQARVAQVVARFVGGGGQSIAFYEAYALTLGYTITIDQFAPFRVGINRVGQPLYSTAWAFAWQVNAPAVTVEYFTVGESNVGQPLVTVLGSTTLQCELQRLAPAHTIVIFSY